MIDILKEEINVSLKEIKEKIIWKMDKINKFLKEFQGSPGKKEVKEMNKAV